MTTPIVALHQVTGNAGGPRAKWGFYSTVLGLRLLKRTVNFDAPDTYHLYYGDEIGHPGTILTFFPWPDAPKGHRGTGQALTTSFLIPEQSIGYWKDRLKNNDICFNGPTKRFNNEQVLTLYDPDGL